MIISSAIISLREGIEAALIIAIMLSYLKRTNQTDLKRYVIVGVIVALVSSLGVAVGVGLIWGIFEGPMLSIFEGFVVLLAAILLTTMIVWMWNIGPTISQEIESSMKSNIVKQSGIGLALLSFSLVMREGVELTLFSIALVIEEGYQTYIGIILGLTLAVLIGVGIYKGSLKINMRSLFKWTSIFLILFAAGMIAYGIHELQDGGFLLIGPAEIWNINPPQLPDGSYPLLNERGAIGSIAKALFGYNGNPSALEVIAYFSYLGIALGYYWRMQRKSRSRQITTQEKTLQTISPAH